MGTANTKSVGRFAQGTPIWPGQEQAAIDILSRDPNITTYPVDGPVPDGYKPYATVRGVMYAIKNSSRPSFSAKASAVWNTFWDKHKADFETALKSSGSIVAGVSLRVAKEAFNVYAKDGLSAARYFLVSKGVPPAAAQSIIQLMGHTSQDIINRGLDKAIVSVDERASAESRAAMDQIAQVAAAAANSTRIGMHEPLITDVTGGFAAVKAHLARRSQKTGSWENIDVLYRDVNAYVGACEGCGCESGSKVLFVGGAEDLSTLTEYSSSANLAAKSKIIKNIIAALGALLPDVIRGTTDTEKIQSIITHLNGKQFKAERVEGILKQIITAINTAFGFEVLTTDLNSQLAARQAVELLISLQSGVYMEFIVVYNNVSNTLKNLRILRELAKQTCILLERRVRKLDDAAKLELLHLVDSWEHILAEYDRQIAILSTLLNVHLSPSDRELQTLLERDKALLANFIRADKGDMPGGTFADSVHKILLSTGITANLATVVNEALKKVGLTMQDYANAKSANELTEKITKKLLETNMTDEQKNEFLLAAEYLHNNISNAKRIADALPKSGSNEDENNIIGNGYTGGACNVEAYFRDIPYEEAISVSGGHDDNRSGSYEGGAVPGRYDISRVSKALLDKKKIRTLLFNAFWKSLYSYYDGLINALTVLSNKIGKEIPISDQLDTFRVAFGRLQLGIVENSHVYEALIGYYNDSSSKNVKDNFLNSLKDINDACAGLVENSMYAASATYFKTIQAQIAAINDLVKKYNDEITSRFGTGLRQGAGDIDDADAGDVSGAADDTGNGDVSGAAEGGGTLFTASPPRYTSGKTIIKAIQIFDHKYRVAQITEGMAHSAKELSTYGEEYNSKLTKHIASCLNTINSQALAHRAALAQALNVQPTASEATETRTHLNKILPRIGSNALTMQLTAYDDFHVRQTEVRTKIWSTFEAVDKYLHHFVSAVARSPDSIKVVKDFLDNVAYINNTSYNDKSGDYLARAFEFMPTGIGKTRAHDRVVDDVTFGGANADSYYDWLSKNDASNPFLVTTPLMGLESAKALKASAINFVILKNLLSVFHYVGSQFDGEAIHSKVFMSPTHMYDNIVDYLAMSAYVQGFGTYDLSDHSRINANGAAGGGVAMRGLGARLDITGAAAAAYPTDAELSSAYLDGSYPIGVSTSGHYNTSGVDIPAAAGGPKPFTVEEHCRLLGGVWFRPIESERSTIAAAALGVHPSRYVPPHSDWKFEDQIFGLMIKAMAAKILTVTCMYDVFHRPVAYNGLHPVRMIIGGGVIDTPKIDDALIELYLRLPLLATFYRRVFNYDDELSYKDRRPLPRRNTAVKITLLPDIEGPFAGLVRLIFAKLRTNDLKDLTDIELKEVIAEVNSIYSKLASVYKDNVVMGIIREFISEVNRKYALVDKDDLTLFKEENGERYNTTVYNDISSYDDIPAIGELSILPGEGDDIIQPPGPAEIQANTLRAEERIFNTSYGVSPSHQRLVYAYRCIVEGELSKGDDAISFKRNIKNTEYRVRRETDNDKRFAIVAQLLRGTDLHSKTNDAKYLLFHETVAAGLNLLSGIQTFLSRFVERCELINMKAHFDAIFDKWLAMPPSAAPAVSQRPLTYDNLKTCIRDELLVRLRINPSDAERVAYMTKYVESLLGEYSNTMLHGGSVAATTAGANQHRRQNNGIPAATLICGTNAYVRNLELGIVHNAHTFAAVSAAGGFAERHIKGSDLLTSDCAITVIDGAGGADAWGTPAHAALDNLLIGGVVRVYKELFYADQVDNRDLTKLAAQQAITLFMRHTFDNEFVMKELLELLLDLQCDSQKMCEVVMNKDGIRLSFNKLREHITTLFDNVTYYIDLLRPHMSTAVLQKYTSINVVGSLNWLRENLENSLLEGRPMHGDHVTRRLGSKLEQYEGMLNITYNWLIKSVPYNNHALGAHSRLINDTAPGGGLGPNDYRADAKNYYTYDRVFADMLFYDNYRADSGVQPSKLTAAEYEDIPTGAPGADVTCRDGVVVADWLNDPHDSLLVRGGPGEKVVDVRYIARFAQLYQWNHSLTYNRSALFGFNQLIAKYIYQFYDPVSTKIYNGLINDFARSTFSKNIQNPAFTYPDTVPMVASVDSRTVDPLKVSKLTEKVRTATLVEPVNVLTRALDAYMQLRDANTIDLADPLQRRKWDSLIVPTGDQPRIAITAAAMHISLALASVLIYELLQHAHELIGNLHHADTYIVGVSKAFVHALLNKPRAGGADGDEDHQNAASKAYRYDLALVYLLYRLSGVPRIGLHNNEGGLLAPVDTTLARMITHTAGLANAGIFASGDAAARLNGWTLAQICQFYTGTAGASMNDLKKITLEQIMKKMFKGSDLDLKHRYNHIYRHIFAHNTTIANFLDTAPNIAAANRGGPALLAGPAIATFRATVLTCSAGLTGGGADIDPLQYAAAGTVQAKVALVARLMAARHADAAAHNPSGLLALLGIANMFGGGHMSFGLMLAQAEAKMKPQTTGVGKALCTTGLAIAYITQYLFRYQNDFEKTLDNAVAIAAAAPLPFLAIGETVSDILIRFATHPATGHRRASLMSEFFTLITQFSLEKLKTKLPGAAGAQALSARAAGADWRGPPPAGAGGDGIIKQVIVDVNAETAKIYKEIFQVETINYDSGEHHVYSFAVREEDFQRFRKVIKADDWDPTVRYYYTYLYGDLDPGQWVPEGFNHTQAAIKAGVTLPANMTIRREHRFNMRLPPDGDHVLYTSLSVILNNLITSKTRRTNTLHYIAENIADIPFVTKEKYRAYLPQFYKHFDILGKRVDFIRKFMQTMPLDCMNADYSAAGPILRQYLGAAATIPNHNPSPGLLKAMPATALERLQRYSDVAESIRRGCKSFMDACTQVMRETGDDPKCFEMYQNSIKDFKAQNGVDPILPLSSTLAFMRYQEVSEADEFLPLHTPGDTNFKYAYATRGFLHGTAAVSPVNVPGFAAIVERYNTQSESTRAIAKDKVDTYLKSFAALARYLFDVKHINGNLTPYYAVPHDMKLDGANRAHLTNGAFIRDDLVFALRDRPSTADRVAGDAMSIYQPGSDVKLGTNVGIIAHGKNKNAVYGLRNNLTSVITLSERDDPDKRIAEIIACLEDASDKKYLADVQNILDLNVVPINFNALQRDIPLANIYNMAFTFDRLCIEYLYGDNPEKCRSLIHELCNADASGMIDKVDDARSAMLALLLKPHLDFRTARPPTTVNANAVLDNYIYNMMLGDVDMAEFSRPVYLSDQLGGKLLAGMEYNFRKHHTGTPTGYKYAPAVKDIFNRLMCSMKRYSGNRWGAGGNIATLFDGGYGDAAVANVHGRIYDIIEANHTYDDIQKGIYTQLLKCNTLAHARNRALGRDAAGAHDDNDLNTHVGDYGGATHAIDADVLAYVHNGHASAFAHGPNLLYAIPFIGIIMYEAAQIIQAVISNPPLDMTDADIITTTGAIGVATQILLTQCPTGTGQYMGFASRQDLIDQLKKFKTTRVGQSMPFAAAADGGGAVGGAGTTGTAVNLAFVAGGKIFKTPDAVVSLNIGGSVYNKFIDKIIARSSSMGVANGRQETLLKVGTKAEVVADLDVATQAVRDSTDHGLAAVEVYKLKQLKPGETATPQLSGIAPVGMTTLEPQTRALPIIARLRFDTTVVRNLLHIVNVYRLVRAIIERNLFRNDDLVASGISLVDPKNTEFDNTDTSRFRAARNKYNEANYFKRHLH